MSERYVLVGKTPVAEPDLMAWAVWFETADRIVARTEIPGVVVSTVFLGLDHGWGMGSPLLFETMVFRDGVADECDRCSTWEQAEAQHAAALERLAPVGGKA